MTAESQHNQPATIMQKLDSPRADSSLSQSSLLSGRRRPSLLDMPHEIQLKIYGYTVNSYSLQNKTFNKLISIKTHHKLENSTALLLTCKAVSPLVEEARVKAFDGRLSFGFNLQNLPERVSQSCSKWPAFKLLITHVDRVQTVGWHLVDSRSALVDHFSILPSLKIVETRERQWTHQSLRVALNILSSRRWKFRRARLENVKFCVQFARYCFETDELDEYTTYRAEDSGLIAIHRYNGKPENYVEPTTEICTTGPPLEVPAGVDKVAAGYYIPYT